MTAGWLVLVAADMGRALLVLLGTYDPSSPVEAGWLVAYALWGAAVLEPSVATLTDPVPAPRTGLTQARLLSLAGASLMAPAILAIQALRDQRLDIPVIVAAPCCSCWCWSGWPTWSARTRPPCASCAAPRACCGPR